MWREPLDGMQQQDWLCAMSPVSRDARLCATGGLFHGRLKGRDSIAGSLLGVRGEQRRARASE